MCVDGARQWSRLSRPAVLYSWPERQKVSVPSLDVLSALDMIVLMLCVLLGLRSFDSGSLRRAALCQQASLCSRGLACGESATCVSVAQLKLPTQPRGCQAPQLPQHPSTPVAGKHGAVHNHAGQLASNW